MEANDSHTGTTPRYSSMESCGCNAHSSRSARSPREARTSSNGDKAHSASTARTNARSMSAFDSTSKATTNASAVARHSDDVFAPNGTRKSAQRTSSSADPNPMSRPPASDSGALPPNPTRSDSSSAVPSAFATASTARNAVVLSMRAAGRANTATSKNAAMMVTPPDSGFSPVITANVSTDARLLMLAPSPNRTRHAASPAAASRNQRFFTVDSASMMLPCHPLKPST